MHRDPNVVLQALEVGAMAYVVKDAATDELVMAIREVQKGNRYLEHSFAVDLAFLRTPSRPHLLSDLTPRELDVLTLLAEGKSYSFIAQKLSISYKTVANISWQLTNRFIS
jgi:DNA-binding NarL/FixJ family response regulator